MEHFYYQLLASSVFSVFRLQYLLSTLKNVILWFLDIKNASVNNKQCQDSVVLYWVFLS